LREPVGQDDWNARRKRQNAPVGNFANRQNGVVEGGELGQGEGDVEDAVIVEQPGADPVGQGPADREFSDTGIAVDVHDYGAGSVTHGTIRAGREIDRKRREGTSRGT
jgi:hypothetical protein